jgi:hypothetical protein
MIGLVWKTITKLRRKSASGSYPEQRHRRDVGRNMRGHGNEKRRRHRSERNPDQGVTRSRRRFARLFSRRVGRQFIRRAQQEDGANREQNNQDNEQQRPGIRLLTEPRERLNEQRIAEQGGEASDIARGIEKIRIARRRMRGAGEPRLQQRRIGRQRKKRQPDRNREKSEQPEFRALRRRPAPSARHAEWQHERGGDHDQQVDKNRRTAGQIARQQVRIEITREQCRLKEDKRNGPDGRSAAQRRQHDLREQWLDRE